MKTLGSNLALALLASAALSGCASTTPEWDQHFGQVQRNTTAAQILYPNAGQKEQPLAMDGQAARETMTRYRGTFREPPPPQNVFNIGVGSASGAR